MRDITFPFFVSGLVAAWKGRGQKAVWFAQHGSAKLLAESVSCDGGGQAVRQASIQPFLFAITSPPPASNPRALRSAGPLQRFLPASAG